jgi:signal peptidase II
MSAGMRMPTSTPNSAAVAPTIYSAAANVVNSPDRKQTRCFMGWLALTGLVVVLDQASKAWMLTLLQPGESRVLAPVFNLTLLFNTGASFSFLADAGGWQRWFFVVLALAISAWLLALLRAHAGERLLACGCALILGGAIGNVIDRICFGAVTDFLHFYWGEHYFPAFNVADSCITVGVILMIWHELFGKGRRA